MKREFRKFEYKPEILMPLEAEITAIGVSNGVPVFWALVNPDYKTEIRYFKSFGTGWRFDKNEYPILKSLGTILLNSGEVLCHLVELKKP